MTKEEAAKELDGNTYGREGSSALWAKMKAAGLVAAYGASDDLMEFEGAIHDEFGAWNGGDAYVSADGRAQDTEFPGGVRIAAVWDGEGELAWSYETTIPHATFNIMEDGEVFCRGIVFALADVPAVDPHADDPLWRLCREFIRKHQISCAEAAGEDRVYEHAPDLVEEIGKLVGFYQPTA